MRIVDLHCDTISEITERNLKLYKNNCQFDIERALKANIFLQFFALFSSPEAPDIMLRKILKQVNKFKNELETNSKYVYHVKDYNDILNNLDNNKIGCVLHLEGADCIDYDLEIIEILYTLGLRSIGLTWNNSNVVADGVVEKDNSKGLSQFGRQFVQNLERLGVIVDLAHSSEKTFYDTIEYYNKPIMVTHANSYSICNHPRNLKDNQLKVLAQNGGVIGLTQVEFFIKENNPTIEDFIDHIKHITDLIGIEYVALGSDFDGAEEMVINNISGYSKLYNILINRGFTDKDISKIFSENAMRVIQQII